MKKTLQIAWTRKRGLNLVLYLAMVGGGAIPVVAQSSVEVPTPPAIAAINPAQPVTLNVSGEVPGALTLSLEDLSKLPRSEVRAKGHDDKESVYAGTTLTEVLRAAGMKFDPGVMPGKGAIASYVLIEAADGYKAVYALAELDPTQTDRVVLLADHKDGQPLTSPEGPLRIIVPGDKRPARWVRQVVALSVHKG